MQASNATTAIQFFLSSHDTWEAIYDDCRKANKSIDMEQYILIPDQIGLRFVELFCEKARQGINIRLLLDKVGSRQMYYSPYVQQMREAGVLVRFFNNISFGDILSPRTCFPRDHIKTLMIDETVGYTGGVCFDANMFTWRDTQIRFTGLLAQDVQENINELWQHQEGYNPKRYRDANFQYVVSTPRIRKNTIYKHLKKQINKAQDYIYLVTPFFMPSRLFIRTLSKAVKRGVDVRLIVTGKTDVLFADCVSQSYFLHLLRAGIKVFSYNKTVLHAKYAVIDDKWATVGSMNLDYLSLFLNREANVVVHEQEVVKEMRRQAEADLAESVVYDYDYWKKRPLMHKIIGYLGRPLKRFI